MHLCTRIMNFINAMMDLEEAQKLPITAIHNSFISKFSF